MSDFFDFIKTLIEKYGFKSLIAFVLTIFTVTVIPKAWIEKLPFNDVSIYWAMGVSFAIWLIILHCIILIFGKIRDKISYNIYREKSNKGSNKEALELLWTTIDRFSENDRKDIMNFLNTNNEPVSKGGTFLDGLYNSNIVIKTEKRIPVDEKVVYGTDEKIKMTRYDTHLYKLQDSIYKALKYSLDEYGRISHFE
ncbi:MAG: hypothetical protein HFJ20_01795 [Clostridia bacterium]|nr:hypothetical protein [Clostridia bacterium]